MGHFTGQRAWMPIEDVVNKQSGVLVGERCNKFSTATRAPRGVHVPNNVSISSTHQCYHVYV